MGQVTFLGACGTVTGSSTLLSFGKHRVLVDCGLFQGAEELEQRNWEPFPFAPSSLTAVVLTHAHLDHSGRLPRLVAEGFEGPVYTSRRGRGLVSLVLQDSGQLQEEQAAWARSKAYSRHADPRPLYTSRDVRQTLRQLVSLEIGEQEEVARGVQVRLHRAGHLLGAASFTVRAKGEARQERAWCFSGDIGRYGAPLLEDPEPPPDELDALVMESTYGDRRHNRGEAQDALGRVIRATLERGGTVLIPAFALGRTQEVLYHLSSLADAGALQPEDVYLDSPMAIAATALYRKAIEEHDEAMLELARDELGPLHPERFHHTRTVAESKALNERAKPAVIVASSGMANGGRIVHHLARRLPDPRSSVVFVGYQGAGTRGRALLEGAEVVAIHGKEVPVRAAVHDLPMLSAHADREELLRWAGSLGTPPRRVFLTHGEDPARKALAASLRELPGWPRPELPLGGQAVPW
jgi:metallo-beta-lactamase family protein